MDYVILKRMRWFAHLLFVTGVLCWSGCVTAPHRPTAPVPATPSPQAVAHAEAVAKFAAASGSPRVHIDLSEQRAYFFKGGKKVTSTRISTGKSGFRTPRGSFRISGKEVSHRSTTYGKHVGSAGEVIDGDVDSRKKAPPAGAKFVGASMPYFMRFNGAVGMHAGYVPSYPASHSCVRLPNSMAQLFYQYAPVGTPVKVTE